MQIDQNSFLETLRVLPPHLVVPFTDRLGADALTAARPHPALFDAVLAHGRPRHLVRLARNPFLAAEQHSRLRELLERRAAELGHSGAEFEDLADAMAALFREERLRPAHELAAGPFGPALAVRLHWERIEVLRPLLATGNVRIAERILTASGSSVTDGEQARAALLLIGHQQQELVRRQVLPGLPGRGFRAPRRRIRVLLWEDVYREVETEGAALPCSQDDPRLRRLRRVAELQESAAGVVEEIRRHPNDVRRVLGAPNRFDWAELAARHRRSPLQLRVREQLLELPDCPAEPARSFLDLRGLRELRGLLQGHPGPGGAGSSPELRGLVYRVARVPGVEKGDLVRHMAPVRVLLGARPLPGEAPPTWDQSYWPDFDPVLRELLAGMTAGQLVRAARLGPEFAGTLPELLAQVREGAADEDVLRSGDTESADPAALHLLLQHAPQPAVREVVRLLRLSRAKELARRSANWNRHLGRLRSGVHPRNDSHRQPLGVYEAVAAVRREAEVRELLPKLDAGQDRDICLMRHGYPDLVVKVLCHSSNHQDLTEAFAAAGPELPAMVLRLLNGRGLAVEAGRLLLDRPDLITEELRARIYTQLGFPRPPLGKTGYFGLQPGQRDPRAPLERVDIAHLQDPEARHVYSWDCAVPWDEVVALYRDGDAVAEEAAWALAELHSFPEELAADFFEVHFEDLLERGRPEEWNRSLCRLAVRQLSRLPRPSDWLSGKLDVGTLDPDEVVQRGAPAVLVLGAALDGSDDPSGSGSGSGTPSPTDVLRSRLAALCRQHLGAGGTVEQPGGTEEQPGGTEGESAAAAVIERWTVAAHLLPAFTGTVPEWLATSRAVAG